MATYKLELINRFIKRLIELGHLDLFLRNLKLYLNYLKNDYDFILNPESKEIHKLTPNGFFGSHNLVFAKLEKFIPLKNVMTIPIELIPENELLLVYSKMGEYLGWYRLNKCKHCFPPNTL